MEDVMNDSGFGRAAMVKFGSVPDGFRVICAEWIGERPSEWKTMRVTGAQFVGSKRIPRTTMSTIVTREEIDANR